MGDEAKLTILGLFVALVVAGGAWYTTHILAAGKAEATAAEAAGNLKATTAAAATTATWQQKLKDVEAAHATELAKLSADAWGPVTVSVSKYPAAATGGVSASPAPPAGVGAAGSTGQLSSGVVCESSGQLQSAYAERERADRMNADYRELYDAWPAPPL